MYKNILLLFLSDVKTKKIDGKVVISETRYENVAGEEKTQITNESALRYLLKDFPVEKIFIFASKTVRGVDKDKTRLLLDGKIWTHEKFSRERFKKFLPGDDRYFVFDYDEDGSDEENLKSVAEMANVIRAYVGDEQSVRLHVDLTGGMRHVNMMMLELTRLLEYSGLKVEKILYSNRDFKTETGCVEEVQNIYELFQLMAGVEEFVNFGSVKALEDYYENKKISEPLKKLLNAMKNFADAIKLCHYGQFNAAIKNLHDAVKDFEPTDDVEDVLMATFIDRIRKDYADLIFPRKTDDLRVIRWCLDNDYLQQALILYTERIPEYIGEKFIVPSEAVDRKIADLIETDRRNYFYYLLNVYSPSIDHTFKGLKFYCNAVKTETAGKKNVDVDAWLERLNAKLSPLKNSLSDEQRLRTQLETFNKIRREPQILSDLSSAELEPIREIVNKLSEELSVVTEYHKRKKIIFDFVNQLPNEQFASYFPNVVFAKDAREKYPRAFQIYELLYDKYISAKIPDEKFLNIMEKYFRIKDERNHSAHAREDYGEFKTVDKLRAFMHRALDELEANLFAQ